MGYYTTFKLNVDSKEDEIETFLKTARKARGDTYYGLYEGLDSFGENVKWYNYEEEMKDLSLEFPDVLFTLEGMGEEQGDHWIRYFKNGKVQVCEAKITFDEYDNQN